MGNELTDQVRRAYAAHELDGRAGGMEVCICGWTSDGSYMDFDEHRVFKISLQVGQWLDANPRVTLRK